MKKAIFAIIFLINYSFGEDFISEFEYGQMLYDNPRGVSCSKCHGKLGEGKFIASFKDDKGLIHQFYGRNISKVNLKDFKKILSTGNKLMPRYYLTDIEIESIYKYIKKVNHIEIKDIKSKKKIASKAKSSNTTDNIKVDADIVEEFDTPAEDLENNKSGGIISKIFNNLDQLEDTDARVSTKSQESEQY